MEYILVKFDEEKRVARVSLRAQELLATLNRKEMEDPNGELVDAIDHFCFILHLYPFQVLHFL